MRNHAHAKKRRTRNNPVSRVNASPAKHDDVVGASEATETLAVRQVVEGGGIYDAKPREEETIWLTRRMG